MNTIYIKVPVSERLPDVQYGLFPVSVDNGESWFTVQYTDSFSFHDEFTDCSGITHWLDKCKLPTEEDAIAKAKYLTSHSNNEGWKEITQFGFITGVKWLFDHIKKGNKK